MLVFLGPEERDFIKEIRRQFPPSVVILDQLTIPQLAAAQARLAASFQMTPAQCTLLPQLERR